MGKRTNITYAGGVVLEAISAGFRYGFEIMDNSGLPDGTVYPALRRLEAAGFLAGNWEAPEEVKKAKRPARRYYELTPEGKLRLAEVRQRFKGLPLVFQRAGGGQNG